MKVGDKIQFKKIRWVITENQCVFPFYNRYWKYKVYRKYKNHGWLNNTDCTYEISYTKWIHFKKQLKKDKNFNYHKIHWTI